MYENIKAGDSVVFKEGKMFEWCIVKETRLEGVMRHFTLIPRSSGKEFSVSINDTMGGAYCPWRFVKASELTEYN